MEINDINNFLEDFGKEVKGITYNDWSFWWFFQDRFFKNKLIAPLPNHEKILREEEITLKDKITLFFLRKGIKYNEKIKHLISNNKRTELGNKKRIMFLAHTNSILPDNECGFTVDRIRSVVKEVRQDPQLEEYISIVDPITHNSGSKLLEYPNLVYPYVDGKIKRKARKHSALLHKKYSFWFTSWKQNIIKNPLFKYFKPALDFFFSKEMIYLIILYYETYKKIIREERIDLLCCYTHGGLITKCAVAAAHNSGIKSVHIPHAIGVSKKLQLSSIYYMTLGKKYKERYVAGGIDPKNIFITGPVFLDEIVPYIQKKHRKTKKILLATVPWVNDNWGDKETYVNYLTKFFKEINKLDVELIIKLHPRETTELYKPLIQDYKNISIVEGTEKEILYSLIQKTDATITFGCTVSLEAVIIGKPSLIIDLKNFIDSDFMITHDPRILHVSPDEDISKIIQKILDGKFNMDKQNEIVRDYLFKLDGRGGKRVVKIIKKILKCKLK